jgi:hypothetical protein
VISFSSLVLSSSSSLRSKTFSHRPPRREMYKNPNTQKAISSIRLWVWRGKRGCRKVAIPFFWVTVTSFLQMKSFRKFFVRAMHGKIHQKKKAPFSSSYEKRSVKTLTFFIKVLLIFARINTLYIHTLRSGK